jgi:Tfp pilus assembly protein PilX
MIRLRNQKGTVLLITYILALMLMGLGMAFFIRAFGGKRLSQIQNDSLKAFYNAEKAVSYAYFESANQGWTWFTHQWDADIADYVPVASAPASLRTAIDTQFVTSGTDTGCYAANDNSFVLKTFSDPNVNNVTVVRAKGISGNVQRVIEYRISRSAIYDFAWWTPYNLNLDSVGSYVNGGRVHSNGDIYMYNAKRLYAVDTISTGKDKSIYYRSYGTYASPGYYDWYVDGTSNINGEVPVPDLAKRPAGSDAQRWAGTTDAQAYATQNPWKYESPPGSGKWHWRSYGYEYAAYWPPRDWRNEEAFFYGDAQARYNQSVEGKTLNYYNTWLWPAQKDVNGDLVFDADGNVLKETPEEIPAELEGAMWDWTKYNNYGKFDGNPQQALKFTVYDPDTGGTKYVEDTRWKIMTNVDGSKSVVMTGISDPEGVTYWNMLSRYDYWRALGYSDADATTWSTHINPELLDGTYGSEYTVGQTTIQIDKTNSMKQPAAWNSFLTAKGLDDVLLANEKGENMEAPRFATTYKEKSKQAGLYFSKSGGSHTLKYGSGQSLTYTAHTCGAYDPTDSNAYNNWLTCLEQSIDVLVDRLNTDVDGNPLSNPERSAKKVKFINTYTNKWNVVLELDLDKMKTAGTFPANGIIYSELPIRLSNANKLPSVGPANQASFNVISEENIYLKGDYNNPASNDQWMTSSIISKKQITTLSNDFNDPQFTPAFLYYPNYPNVYVVDDGASLTEADPNAGGGDWKYYSQYPSGDPRRTQAYDLMNSINSDWSLTFDKNDPNGDRLYTVSSSHPIIDGQAWGAMPNRVQQNHTYNSLLASYYNGSSPNIPNGVELERWINNAGSTRKKAMKGAFFQLERTAETDPERFVAYPSDGPLDYWYYATFDRRANSRVSGSPYSGPYYTISPSRNASYDARFRNPLIAQSKPIFFGGGESSWRELGTTDF